VKGEFSFTAHVHLLEKPVRKILWTILGCWFCGLLAAAAAETFPLADGTTVSGDIVSSTENGIIFRTDGDKYSDRLPWIKFSQAGLQQLAQNPKIEPLVEPFIEVPPPRPQKTDVKIGDVPRLERPASASLFGALFSSSVGLVVLLLIYAANLFAGYEIALFRAKPVALVMGVAAVLPILGPIIFLSMVPPRVKAAPVAETPLETGAPAAASEPHRYAMPGSPPPGEIHIVASSWQASPDAGPERPQPQIFQRGMFMFNRRFFETKFSGFFNVVRTGADKEKVLLVKTLREQLVVERISRIAANDAHFEVVRGGVRQEIMVPFAEIQEIQVQPKEA
jgi:hypothetical protein